MQAYPLLGIDEIMDLLEDNAVDLGSAGKDNAYGAGRIDVYKAIGKYGTITSNETWSNIIYIIGDVTIQSGVTLTIQSGTTIKFVAGDVETSGKSSTKLEIIVNGILQADNVTFTAASKGDWYGIRFDSLSTSASNASYLKNSTLENGDYPLWVDNCYPTIDGNTISNASGTGIVVKGTGATSSLEIKNCSVSNVDNIGMSVVYGSNPTVHDNSFNISSHECVYTNVDVDGHYYDNDCTSGHDKYFYLRDGYPDVGGNGSGLMGNSIHNNSNYDDVIFYISGGQPDLGVNSGSCDGNNSLDHDQASGRYYIWNVSGNTVKAEDNYWGTSSPGSAKFYDLNDIDYIPYLSSDPHLSKSLADDENELAPGKDSKKQTEYGEAFNKFKKVLDETDDDVNAAYALGNMFACAKLNHSLLSFEKDLESYTTDSRKEVNVRAKMCLGKLYAYTERLEKAEDMLKSFKAGTNADREALLHLLDYYVIYGEKETAAHLANTMRNRFQEDKYLESDIAYAFEMPNYGSKRDLIYSGDLAKTEPALALESEKVNGMSVYPNPFNAEAKVVFNVDEAGRVHLAVFNTLGQKVRTLADQRMEQGSHEIFWNGLDDYGNQVSTGLYFVSLVADNKRQIAKMVFAK